jgi:transcriptional regulator with PAS, ATPase and Fis domain
MDDHRRMLESHTWPGNVRELRNVMERYVLLNGRLEFVQATRDPRGEGSSGDAGKVSSAPVDENERNMIYAMLLKKLLASEKIELPVSIPNPNKGVGV